MNVHPGCWVAGPLLMSGGAHGIAQAPQVNNEAALMADFAKRVDAYVQLRDTLQKDTPKLEKKSEPAEITAAEKALAGADPRGAFGGKARRHLHSVDSSQVQAPPEPRAQGTGWP